jgi:hypothetical protein
MNYITYPRVLVAVVFNWISHMVPLCVPVGAGGMGGCTATAGLSSADAERAVTEALKADISLRSAAAAKQIQEKVLHVHREAVLLQLHCIMFIITVCNRAHAPA